MIKIICIGKIKERYLEELIEDYSKRIQKYHKLQIIQLKDSQLKNESEEIKKHINDKDYNICLDIEGKELSSIELSNLIDKTFSQGYSNITFIIGGSEGVSNDIKQKCNLKISFSKLTFPHGLFRGILLEQIYRSLKILSNETYHK